MDRDDAIDLTEPLIDNTARDVVTVTGTDAQSYLQSQVSQEVGDLAVGAARWTFVLDPTGKVVSLARLRRIADDGFTLDTDAGFGEALLARITRFMIRVDVTAELAPAASIHPSDDSEQARVAAGWPRMGSEITPGETIPSTIGVVLLAVDFAKGCYPGQELVERMDSRGADAPRSLRVIDVDPAARPAVGDDVSADGTPVGVVTSVAPDGATAIASVKRGHDVGRVPAHLAAD